MIEFKGNIYVVTLDSNNIATDSNALYAYGGDTSTSPAVFTLPAINFDSYTSSGDVTFRFGVKNQNEHMYFGSGGSKIDLGNNQTNGNSLNGYVNWEMTISSETATIHNNFTNQNYSIALTTGIRNGTERMVFSGGAQSRWRNYLFTDFYLVS